MWFEINCAKSHHRVISDGLLSNKSSDKIGIVSYEKNLYFLRKKISVLIGQQRDRFRVFWGKRERVHHDIHLPIHHSGKSCGMHWTSFDHLSFSVTFTKSLHIFSVISGHIPRFSMITMATFSFFKAAVIISVSTLWRRYVWNDLSHIIATLRFECVYDSLSLVWE